MGNILTTVLRSIKDLWNIATRKFPTKYHASKWPEVERLFCTRSMIAQTVYMAGWIMINVKEISRPARVQELLDEDGIPNAQLARDVHPYGKVLLITMGTLRVVLLLMSLRWRKVCKSFVFVMTLHKII